MHEKDRPLQVVLVHPPQANYVTHFEKCIHEQPAFAIDESGGEHIVEVLEFVHEEIRRVAHSIGKRTETRRVDLFSNETNGSELELSRQRKVDLENADILVTADPNPMLLSSLMAIARDRLLGRGLFAWSSKETFDLNLQLLSTGRIPVFIPNQNAKDSQQILSRFYGFYADPQKSEEEWREQALTPTRFAVNFPRIPTTGIARKKLTQLHITGEHPAAQDAPLRATLVDVQMEERQRNQEQHEQRVMAARKMDEYIAKRTTTSHPI